jgi:hypothetical protein
MFFSHGRRDGIDWHPFHFISCFKKPFLDNNTKGRTQFVINQSNFPQGDLSFFTGFPREISFEFGVRATFKF